MKTVYYALAQLRQMFWRLLDELFVGLALAVGIYLNWSLISIALLVFVVWQFLRPLPSRRIVPVVAVAWGLVPVAFLLRREVLAVQFWIKIKREL